MSKRPGRDAPGDTAPAGAHGPAAGTDTPAAGAAGAADSAGAAGAAGSAGAAGAAGSAGAAGAAGAAGLAVFDDDGDAGPGIDPGADTPPRLEILKALGDNTRYAIYLELARSPHPLATADVARSLGLHPNTVRPHLERMRELGLLDQRVDSRGGVGRPQHLYSLAADAPSLGLEPPAFPRLARMLLRLAADAGIAAEDAVEVGRDQGRYDAGRAREGTPCGAALLSMLAEFGFDPVQVVDDEAATVGFMHCPFRELAEANPTIVCGIHRGMVEGFVERRGGARVTSFRTLVDRDHPCQTDLELTA